MIKNARAKGNATVRRGRALLEKEGWYTDIVEKGGKFRKVKDLFDGLFDVIAIVPGRTKLIQFKTNRMPTYKPFQDFADKYYQFEVEIWCWKDYLGFEIVLFNNGKRTKIKLFDKQKQGKQNARKTKR